MFKMFLHCPSFFYVTNLPLLHIKTHCSVIRVYWIKPFSSNIFLHDSWLWERCQVWFVIVRLHLKLRLNNSIFLVGVTSEGGKCLSAKVMFTTCRILNIPKGGFPKKKTVFFWNFSQNKIAPYGLKCKINHKKFQLRGSQRGGRVSSIPKTFGKFTKLKVALKTP